MKHKKFSISPVKNYKPEYPLKKQIKSETIFKKAKNLLLSGGIMLLAAGCTENIESSEMCDPGVNCNENYVAEICDLNHVTSTVNCNNWCVQEYGEDAYAIGCTEDINQPCNCEYGGLDGMIAECTPGEERCTNTGIEVCVDLSGYYGWEHYSCNEYCNEEYGDHYVSYDGCNSELDENLCQCEYEMIDGNMPACNPEDIACDGDNLLVCNNDTLSFETVNCSDKCSEEYGNSFVSEGCDASNPDNPCLCTNE
ncbi:MAG: hypothetical protein ACQES9_10730 [Myxococcota bacterium]